MVACKEYDKKLTLLHSESEYFKIKFSRNIEPGCLEVLDPKCKVDGDKTTLWLTSKRDNRFSIDIASFQIPKEQVQPDLENRQSKTELLTAESANKFVEKYDDVINIHKVSEESSTTATFATKWPFTAFTGLKKGFVFILNSYE